MGNCERFQKASDKNRGEVTARTEGIEVEEGNGDPDRSDEDHCPTSLGPETLLTRRKPEGRQQSRGCNRAGSNRGMASAYREEAAFVGCNDGQGDELNKGTH